MRRTCWTEHSGRKSFRLVISNPSFQNCPRAFRPIKSCQSPKRSTISNSPVSNAANRLGSDPLYAEHQALTSSCALFSIGVGTNRVCDDPFVSSSGEEWSFRSEPTRLCVPWLSAKKCSRRKRMRMIVKIKDIDPPTAHRKLIMDPQRVGPSYGRGECRKPQNT